MLTLPAILSLLLCSKVAIVTLCKGKEIVPLSGFQLPAYRKQASKMTVTAFDLFISTYFLISVDICPNAPTVIQREAHYNFITRCVTCSKYSRMNTLRNYKRSFKLKLAFSSNISRLLTPKIITNWSLSVITFESKSTNRKWQLNWGNLHNDSEVVSCSVMNFV